jgi:uncharacterized protein (TIRG00374 family)
MTRGKLISTLVAIVLSVVFLVIAFRRIEFGQLVETFRTIQWLYAVPFVAVTWVTFWWRGWRWMKLLRATHRLRLRDVFGPMMVGFGFNSIFPARAGEFARPLALVKQANVPYTTGFSSVVVERIWDILALLFFFILCSFFITFDDSIAYAYGELTITPATLEGIVRKVSILAAVLLAGSLTMLSGRCRDLMRWILHRLPLLPDKVRATLVALFDSFALGFEALRRPALVAQVAFDSLGIWFLTGLTFWIMALGFPGFEMTVGHAMVFLVVTCLMVSLPSAPGYWGLYEVGGLIALKLVDPQIDESLAMGYTLVVHFLQWALVTVVGLYYAGRIHVSVKEVPSDVELKT